ncbi:hypothetical protein JCM16307_02730 [Thermococcus prieurii]
MRVREAKTEAEREVCLRIARNLPEWFNEAGLKAIERDLREKTTFVAVKGSDVLGFVTVKPTNRKALKILWMVVKRELRGRG